MTNKNIKMGQLTIGSMILSYFLLLLMGGFGVFIAICIFLYYFDKIDRERERETSIDKEKETSSESKLEFEPHNFKVNSDGWERNYTYVDGKPYLENPEKDIWEILDDECAGEQLFTWDAAMRETKKAGKRMPTDDEFSEILKVDEFFEPLKIKEDMPNLIFAGLRSPGYPDGSFENRGEYVFFWSSTESGTSAWRRDLFRGSGGSELGRGMDDKTEGFSVRCLKD